MYKGRFNNIWRHQFLWFKGIQLTVLKIILILNSWTDYTNLKLVDKIGLIIEIWLQKCYIWFFFLNWLEPIIYKNWCTANIDKNTAYRYISTCITAIYCFHTIICRVKILLDLLGLICTTLIIPTTALHGDQVGPTSIDSIWGGQIKIHCINKNQVKMEHNLHVDSVLIILPTIISFQDYNMV